jgi:hypothetical protein
VVVDDVDGQMLGGPVLQRCQQVAPHLLHSKGSQAADSMILIKTPVGMEASKQAASIIHHHTDRQTHNRLLAARTA